MFAGPILFKLNVINWTAGLWNIYLLFKVLGSILFTYYFLVLWENDKLFELWFLRLLNYNCLELMLMLVEQLFRYLNNTGLLTAVSEDTLGHFLSFIIHLDSLIFLLLLFLINLNIFKLMLDVPFYSWTVKFYQMFISFTFSFSFMFLINDYLSWARSWGGR